MVRMRSLGRFAGPSLFRMVACDPLSLSGGSFALVREPTESPLARAIGGSAVGSGCGSEWACGWRRERVTRRRRV